MRIAARDYIGFGATGQNLADYDRMQELGKVVAERFSTSVSCSVARLDSVQGIEDELRDPDLVLAASGGSLPVFLVNLTYDVDHVVATDLDELVRELDLRLVAESVNERR